MSLGFRITCRAIFALTLLNAVTTDLAWAAGPGKDSAGIGAPPIYGEPFAEQPFDLGEAAPAQIGATFALAAPGFVGDFFGGATGSATSMVIDRLLVVSDDIGEDAPNFGSNMPYTATDSSGQRGVIDPANQQILFIQSGVPATFTTAISSSELLTLLAASPRPNIPIIDNSGYRMLANDQFNLRRGNIGVTTFNSGASSAVPQSGPNFAGDGVDWDVAYAYDYVVNVNVPSPSSGGVVGRQKLVENSSPIPRDRILFNYSLFQNVRFVPGGIDVNRFVAGFEKTFWDQQISLELRAPFASTLNSDLVLGSQTSGTNTEFGNLTLYGKALLLTGQSFALGAGLGLAFPTADDVNVRAADGVPLAAIKNDAVHLLPYVGGIYAPNERFYAQAILQFDIDANGNPVYITDFQNGLQQVGSLNDTTWCFASFNMGYWMYRAPTSQRLSGVSPLFEIHYNKTLQRSDTVQSSGIRLGDAFENIEMINLVAGANFEIFGMSYVSLAYIAPVTGGNDRFFDGEFRALFNRYF